MMETMMKIYMMAIYETGGEKEFVRTSDVAKVLGYSPPSVTEAFHKMAKEGVVEYIPYRGVKLTEKGKKIGEKTIARQNTLRRLLLCIGAPQDLAEIECKKLEPVMTDRCIEYIRNFLKNQEGQND
ncbi:MAG: metal-dependent transcriptional regulator [Thermoplasmata archaeon]|nr:metal-dependent transcriptional regulator [Thermoplasmata archaeon]